MFDRVQKVTDMNSCDKTGPQKPAVYLNVTEL